MQAKLYTPLRPHIILLEEITSRQEGQEGQRRGHHLVYFLSSASSPQQQHPYLLSTFFHFSFASRKQSCPKTERIQEHDASKHKTERKNEKRRDISWRGSGSAEATRDHPTPRLQVHALLQVCATCLPCTRTRTPHHAIALVAESGHAKPSISLISKFIIPVDVDRPRRCNCKNGFGNGG